MACGRCGASGCRVRGVASNLRFHRLLGCFGNVQGLDVLLPFLIGGLHVGRGRSAVVTVGTAGLEANRGNHCQQQQINSFIGEHKNSFTSDAESPCEGGREEGVHGSGGLVVGDDEVGEVFAENLGRVVLGPVVELLIVEDRLRCGSGL